MTNISYIVPLSDNVVTDGFTPFSWILNDRPALDTPEARQKYFARGYRLFREKLDSFSEAAAAPSAHEERELIFMLQALVEAKHRLHG